MSCVAVRRLWSAGVCAMLVLRGTRLDCRVSAWRPTPLLVPSPRGSFNTSLVRYAYTVTVVPNAEFKAESFELATNSSSAQSGVIPGPYRTVYNRHGEGDVVVHDCRRHALSYSTAPWQS